MRPIIYNGKEHHNQGGQNTRSRALEYYKFSEPTIINAGTVSVCQWMESNVDKIAF